MLWRRDAERAREDDMSGGGVGMYFAEGGVFMFVVLGTGVIGLFLCMLAGVAYGWKKWLGFLLGLMFFGLPLCSGLIGTGMGYWQMRQSLVLADPASAEALKAAGERIAMYPTYWGLIWFCACFGIFLFFGLISSAIFTRRRNKKIIEGD
jgi:hypothetical protein